MSIKTLKEMMGMEADDIIVYPLPQLNTDALDAIGNVQKYTATKMVLEHPEVNAVLKRMDAFDTLNVYSVEPSYQLAQWVVEALREYYGEDETAYYNAFPFTPDHDGLSEFGDEFITELSSMKAGTMPDVAADMPDEDQGWFDKVAAKFGFHDIGFKELMWLYIMNQAKQGMSSKEPNRMETPAKPVVTESAPLGDDVLAGINGELPESLTEWVESLTASYTKEFGQRWGEALYEQALEQYTLITHINEYGSLQQQFKQQVKSPEKIVAETKALIQTFTDAMNRASAFGKHAYKKEIESLERFLQTVMRNGGVVAEGDTSSKYTTHCKTCGDTIAKGTRIGAKDCPTHEYGCKTCGVKISAAQAGQYGMKCSDHATVTEDVIIEQDDAGLESGAYNDTRPAPKPSAKVKADVKQRIAELSKLIADDKKKQHFYGDVKPSVYNAKEALERIMDFLNDGTMGGYKQAQIHFQKLMSPITNLFPPTLVKFLAYANDGEDSKVMKPVSEGYMDDEVSLEYIQDKRELKQQASVAAHGSHGEPNAKFVVGAHDGKDFLPVAHSLTPEEANYVIKLVTDFLNKYNEPANVFKVKQDNPKLKTTDPLFFADILPPDGKIR